MAKEKISPGMQQYLDIKEIIQMLFLLFRMGDFLRIIFTRMLLRLPRFWKLA